MSSTHSTTMSATSGQSGEHIVINDVVDNSRFGWFQLRVLLLCMFVAVIDGFDVTAMGAVAPRVAADWHISPGSLGPALSASLVGLAFGGTLGGPLGDRFGRRPVLAAMFLIGVLATIATALAASLPHLIFWRFITGLGLGGTIPLGAALTAEYMPRRMRSFLVVLMFSGHPLGGALASLIAPSIIATWDWHHVFYAGGVLPLIAGVGLWFALPESPRFVALTGNRHRLVSLLRKIEPTFAPRDNQTIGVVREENRKFSLGEVFGQGRRTTTLILWLVFFGTQMNMFVLSSWLPVFFSNAGIPLAMALYAATVYNLGGAAGSIAFGALSDRISSTLVLAVLYVGATIATIFLANASTAGPLLFIASMVAGLGGIGAQLCLNAFTAMLYPGHIRATGLGWALSVGRVGAITGPLIAGALMLNGWQTIDLLYACAVLPTLCAVGAMVLRNRGVGERPVLDVLAH